MVLNGKAVTKIDNFSSRVVLSKTIVLMSRFELDSNDFSTFQFLGI